LPISIRKNQENKFVGNLPANEVSGTLTKVKVSLGWIALTTLHGDFDLDLSAVLIGKETKELVFYGNTQPQYSGVKHSGDNTTGGDENEIIIVDLQQLPANMQEVVFIVSLHESGTKRQTFGKCGEAFVSIADGEKDETIYELDLDDFGSATVLLFGSVKRNTQNRWQWKPIAAGKNDLLEKITQQQYQVDTGKYKFTKEPQKKESPKFHFWCRHCGVKLQAKESTIGRSNACPGCKKTVVIERNTPPKPSAPPPPSTPEEYFNLAMQFLHSRNVGEALKNCRTAAEAGHAEAQYKLGTYYYAGSGVPEDHQEAGKWLRKAALQGHVKAKNLLDELEAKQKSPVPTLPPLPNPPKNQVSEEKAGCAGSGCGCLTWYVAGTILIAAGIPKELAYGIAVIIGAAVGVIMIYLLIDKFKKP